MEKSVISKVAEIHNYLLYPTSPGIRFTQIFLYRPNETERLLYLEIG